MFAYLCSRTPYELEALLTDDHWLQTTADRVGITVAGLEGYMVEALAESIARHSVPAPGGLPSSDDPLAQQLAWRAANGYPPVAPSLEVVREGLRRGRVREHRSLCRADVDVLRTDLDSYGT